MSALETFDRELSQHIVNGKEGSVPAYSVEKLDLARSKNSRRSLNRLEGSVMDPAASSAVTRRREIASG